MQSLSQAAGQAGEKGKHFTDPVEHTQGAQQRRDVCHGHHLGDDLTKSCHVVHQPTGLPVRGVHGAQEAPGLGQQLAHRRGSHLGEGGPSVDAAEVREVADEIQLVPHHTETAVLQHAQPWGTKGDPCQHLIQL